MQFIPKYIILVGLCLAALTIASPTPDLELTLSVKEDGIKSDDLNKWNSPAAYGEHQGQHKGRQTHHISTHEPSQKPIRTMETCYTVNWPVDDGGPVSEGVKHQTGEGFKTETGILAWSHYEQTQPRLYEYALCIWCEENLRDYRFYDVEPDFFELTCIVKGKHCVDFDSDSKDDAKIVQACTRGD